MTRLFDPVRIGRMILPNRIIMAPLTRGRTGARGIPGALVAEYYAQRASAGLLIAEATAVNREGDGWPDAPGLYTDAQESGWRAVAEALKAAGVAAVYTPKDYDLTQIVGDLVAILECESAAEA